VDEYLLKKLLDYLSKHGKYEIRLNYDPPASFADLFMRYLYARQFQKETFDLRKQISGQYKSISMIFHLRRMMRKLKLGKIPIRIIFIAQEPLGWKIVDSFYRACISDSLFMTFVVNVGSLYLDNVEGCSAFFARNNINYLDGINNRFRLDQFTPDIIVLSSPYDDYRPYQYGTANLLRYAQLVYITYGIDFADEAGKLATWTFGLDAQRIAWRVFTRSNSTFGNFKKYGGLPSRRVVPLGLPIIDQYYSSSASGVLPDAIQSASAGKFKIIYAPHHTIDGWSTFLQYAGHIRRLVDENEDCYLVFRPHPKLMGTLMQLNLMSEEEFRGLFTGERCYYYDGEDYYGLFHWSDMLISDASSFLGEYAPTRNPIIYTHCERGWGIDDSLREDVFKSCYVVHSMDEITEIFQQLRNGVDPLKSTRGRYQENINAGMFTGGAGKRIAAYLRDTLA
jgi:hypothetical protein